MLKKLLIPAGALAFIILLASFLKEPATIKPPQRTGLKTIIIDAGHGGKAAGAKGAFSYEKDITLDIALQIGKKLEKAFPEMKVLYTRTEDVFTANPWRADFANKNAGDLFVSIHVNAMPAIKHSKFIGYKRNLLCR
ncbi:MAG: N-acetylmuramoyl-L-alanine amidase [Chitinophagaceae bacterium]|nr:N-acetylmuramoyl-L-alanine amidase [Chitinophagaceae bacterium]